MKYPKSYIEEIKNRLKVSDVVRLKVNLKKRGKEFIGLSPFKNEKTPSFTVNDDKGFYHCFSTGEHGNIFDFIMKLDNLGFGEAIKTLAQRAGMQPYHFTKEDEVREKESQKIQKLFEIFFSICHLDLQSEYKNSHLKYLLDRGLSVDTINYFKIGFCEDSKKIKDKLFQNNFTANELIKSGMYYKKDGSDELVCRFRNRIIFPILNYFNQYIGCGGRSVLKKALAKYINSPETDFFKKGFNLYNLNNSKKESTDTDKLVLVEGYMDVVSLYNKGVKNVAATLGTAITTSQINLAWKNFDKIILCFDGDQSGLDASYRAAERVLKILKPGKDIYFAKIPNSQDPDDFINQFGQNGFYSLLNQSSDLSEIIFNYHAVNVDRSKASEIALLEKKLFQLADEMDDQISKKYIKNSFKNKIFVNLIKNKKNTFSNQGELKQASLRLMLTKEEIIELSLLNLILNYPNLSENKIEDLSAIEFSFKDNKNFLSELISSLTNENIRSKDNLVKKLQINHEGILKKISMYANNKSVISNLNEESFNSFFEDYFAEINLCKKNKELLSLESELVKNPNEDMYNRYISLKNS
ncbi:MAG: DNA primase [alpha proteobacterium HIMB114]|nr:MAG: DNA primase [alpha proteobacterium HIMB114]